MDVMIRAKAAMGGRDLSDIEARVVVLRESAGVAGDTEMAAICDRALAGEVLPLPDVWTLLEMFEIPYTEFWTAAGGGQQTPLDLAGLQAALDDMGA